MTEPQPVVLLAEIDPTIFDDIDDGTATCAMAEEILSAERVSLVLSSSMTRAEMEMCQQKLGLRQPFICESGAAVIVPSRYFPFDVPCDRELAGSHLIEFGGPYSQVVDGLHRTAKRLDIPVVGFSDLSVDQVASACRLSRSHAHLAKLREYDEPFQFLNEAIGSRSQLWRALRAAKLDCTYRGTYEHVGASVNRSMSVGLLASLYRQTFGTLGTPGLGHPTEGALFVTCVLQPRLKGVADPGANPNSRPSTIPGGTPPRRTAWIDAMLEVARRARACVNGQRAAVQ